MAVHNNHITITKTIGIILMVMGHSGCPQLSFRLIYLFHTTFLKKRVRGLDIPFVKWSVFFLLLHNLLLVVGVYNSLYGYEGGALFYSVNGMLSRLSFLITLVYGIDGIGVVHVAEHPVIKNNTPTIVGGYSIVWQV